MIEFIRAIAPYAPVFGLMGLYLLVSVTMDLLVQAYKRDISVFWEEYRFFRSFRLAWRVTVVRHNVRKVLHSGNLDAIRAELDAS